MKLTLATLTLALAVFTVAASDKVKTFYILYNRRILLLFQNNTEQNLRQSNQLSILNQKEINKFSSVSAPNYYLL